MLSATQAGADVATLNASEDSDSAQGYYLRAIISTRQGDVNGTVENLKKAFAKDGSFKEKAAKDKEFLRFIDNATFTAVLK